MVVLGKEYVLCNRVLSDVNEVNRLLAVVSGMLGVKASKVRKGLFKKTCRLRVVITARVFSDNMGNYNIGVYDEDKGKYRVFSKVMVHSGAIKTLPMVRKVVKMVLEGR